MAIHPSIQKLVPELQTIRRDFHANPELGFKENRTASVIARHLEAAGIEIKAGYGGTGLVGTLRGARGGDGPKIGFRADMDALPIAEESGADHASRNPGVMHACGHDGHSAMLLGAAKHLAANRDFAGTVYFIFQPAEELLSGAKAMIDDGLFDDHPADAVFSIHNDPRYPMGTVMTADGAFMAGADHFDLTISGRSGHAARPEECVDPVVLAAQLVTLAQALVTRRIRPTDPAVLTFTRLQSGDSYNVIPERALLSGTFRTMNPDLSAAMEDGLRRLAAGLVESFGGRAALAYRRVCPVLINTGAVTRVAEAAVNDVIEDAKIIRPDQPIMGTEDFAYMVEGRSGCLLRVGARPGDDPVPGLHNAGYDFNDDLLPIGTGIWVRLAERMLGA
jgi:hippurate hydrolase